MGNGKEKAADEVTMIPTSQIVICDDRLRAVDESGVTALMNDMAANGLTQAIEVRALKKGRYELIDGGHRLEAALRLEWLKVKAIVRDCTVDEARMRMALANLTRAELTMLDRALHVWRVKSVWMHMHPERKHGGFRVEGECQAATVSTWTEAIPEGAHLSDRTLARAAEIGEGIKPRTAKIICNTAIADNQKELLALTKFGPEMQYSIADKIAAGKAETVLQAEVMIGGKPDPERLIVPVVKQVSRMWSSWEKMEDEAKQQFILKLKGEGFL